MSIDDLLSAALTRLELHETELLAWGIVDSAFTADELERLLTQATPSGMRADDLKRELLERLLIVQTPSGGYRSRMAETLRLLSKLRQLFPQHRWWEGSPLVLDYRFLHRPRRRPQRDRRKQDVLARLGPHFGAAGRVVLDAVAPACLSGFQERTAGAIAEALATNRDAGVMVTAGAGSGKTLAFYLPALAWIGDLVAVGESPSVRALALYPRGELLKDQLRAVLEMTRSIAASSSARPIRVGTWFGPTPRAARWLKQGWARDWREHKVRGSTFGWICPFLACLRCGGATAWRVQDVERAVERLTCVDPGCSDVIDDRFITLTRERAVSSPPDLMFTTTESLNRQLAAPDQHRAFGLRGTRARMVLLDEVHTYEGASGAQNALLARRLRNAVGRSLVWVGLSATLRNAESFFGQFTGLYGDRVTVTHAAPDELEESGAEYLVALKHDPVSGTSPLSTTIQTAMLLTRCLDAPGSPYEPAPSSQGIVGRKSFVFTDKLDITNRLFWNLLDAEGWWQRARPQNRSVLTLAHLRAGEQARRAPDRRESAEDREAEGQWWWLPEQLGRDLAGDEQLIVGRTSSQDVGVDESADVIVATAALEVGYDDPDVGAVVQHKAPHDTARFVQRKGRAGRDPSMRPWTAVVLSDWGRDRLAWELYDQLFDPELEPRHLPLKNRYVLRMQAVYATLDWLGGRLDTVGRDRSAWVDVVAPAQILETSPERIDAREQRQSAMADLLREVLTGGPAREHLRGHLRKALGFADDDHGWQEIDALLWAPPRPVLLAALPTVLRRLRLNWAGEVPDRQSHEVRTRTPLREFIAGNLFDDLLTPEVQVLVPTGARSEEYEAELLPAVRTIWELMPGNVTRHFGVSSFSRRHWVPFERGSGEAVVDIVETYGGQFTCTLASSRLPAGGVDLYRPVSVSVAVPPTSVRDATSTTPVWGVHAEPLGPGRELSLGKTRWQDVISTIRVHSHAAGGGARVRRFALRATGTVFGGGAPESVRIAFTARAPTGRAVALGVESDVDALRLEVLVPTPIAEPSRLERSDRVTDLLLADPELPSDVNWFQRSNLVSALCVVLAELEPHSAAAFAVLTDEELASRLVDALHRLGLLDAVDPDRADAEDVPGEAGTGRSRGMQRAAMENWCRHAGVLAATRRAASATWASRDPDWLVWGRERFAATVGTVFLEGVARVVPDLDTSDLNIDIDPRGIASSKGPIEVWISELAPGGNGHVEQLHRVLLEDPRRFVRLLDGVLDESELERLDGDVKRFLQFEASDSGVQASSDNVRAAWKDGHAAVARAFEELRDAVHGAGAELARSAWTTIVNRLLGPGAHPSLPETVCGLITRWERLELALGIEVPVRVFGAVCADETALDEVFRLDPAATRYRRSRAVSGYFWPRGGVAARIQLDGGDAFRLLPTPDQALLREALGPEARVIEVDAWNDGIWQRTHQALLDDGYVVLEFASSPDSLVRRMALGSQLEPIDAGAILAHPRVVGVWRRNGRVRLGLVLDEAVT
jgi:hypothetical protein